MGWGLFSTCPAIYYALLSQSRRLICRSKLSNVLLLYISEHFI